MQVHQLRLIGPQSFPQLCNIVFNLALDFRRFCNFVADVNVHASLGARALGRSRWSRSARAIEPGKEPRILLLPMVEAAANAKVAFRNCAAALDSACARRHFVERNFADRKSTRLNS